MIRVSTIAGQGGYGGVPPGGFLARPPEGFLALPPDMVKLAHLWLAQLYPDLRNLQEHGVVS